MSADGHQDFLPPDPLVARADGRQVAFDGFTVLRGSTRVVRTRWADPPAVCWCRVRVSTKDGSGGITTVSGQVLVFPFRATIGVLLVAAGLLLWRMVRRRSAERTRQAVAQARAAGMQEGRMNLNPPPES